MNASISVQNTTYETAANKAFAMKAQTELLVHKDFSVFDRYWKDPYPQHNPLLESGIKSLRDFKEKQLADNTIKIVRVIADRDIVAFHQQVTGFINTPQQVELDIYRISNGKIIEQWNVTQPEHEAGAAIKMLEGATRFEDREKTGYNRVLVTEFMIEVMLGGDLQSMDIFVDDHFIQHDPLIFPGKAGLKKHLKKLHYDIDGLLYYSLHFVIAEANFVWTASETKLGNRDLMVYDLWRVSNDKIVEHWSVSQAMPEATKSGLPVIID